jgi:hypothetical protein
MKKLTTTFFLFALILFGVTTNGQVTNLKVNGQSSSFIISQDIGVTWDCDIPTGQTATFDILMHINGSTFIDPTTDKNLFGTSTMTDGDTKGNNGPPDIPLYLPRVLIRLVLQTTAQQHQLRELLSQRPHRPIP